MSSGFNQRVRRQVLHTSWAIALAAAFMVPTAGASPQREGLRAALNAIKLARSQIQVGQASKPYAVLPLVVDEWQEGMDSRGDTVHFAVNPALVLPTTAGELRIPVHGLGYTTGSDGRLRRFSIRIIGMSSMACLPLEDVRAIFPMGQLISVPNHPLHGTPPPNEQWNVEWRVGGDRHSSDYFSIHFDFERTPMGATPTCVRSVTVGIRAE